MTLDDICHNDYEMIAGLKYHSLDDRAFSDAMIDTVFNSEMLLMASEVITNAAVFNMVNGNLK